MEVNEVKEAVKIAKNYLTELLADEGMSNLGLEAVEYDHLHNLWRVTLGFSRPWNNANAVNVLTGGPPRRAYRIIEVEKGSGDVVAMKLDELVAEN